MAAKAKPTAPRNQNTACQPNWCVIVPMIGAKRTVAKYCAELKIALAVPRSAVGNHAATIRAFAGNDGDSASPSRKRSTKRGTTAEAAPSTPTNPCSSGNPDKGAILQP